jgi:hypothetical protein
MVVFIPTKHRTKLNLSADRYRIIDLDANIALKPRLTDVEKGIELSEPEEQPPPPINVDNDSDETY